MKKVSFNDKNPCVCGAGARLRADAACVKTHEGDLLISEKTVLKGYRILGNLTVAATAAGTAIRDCAVEGNITVLSDEVQVMYCTVSGKITLGAACNQIAAMCVASEIAVEGARNTVVLKNKVGAVTAKNGHAIYVIENAVSGTLTLTDNNYLIADCNAVADTVASGNGNTNGNNLMDVDARLPVGADEKLLPHTDKDLFIDMPRKASVCDPDGKCELALPTYVNSRALTDEFVIIPPGAYVSDEAWSFPPAASGTTVYAYGVYAERQKDCTAQAQFAGVTGVTVKGLTFAFSNPSCGQVHILEKLGMQEDGKSGWVRVVTGAGMIDEFGDYGTHFDKSKWMGAQRMGSFYAYCDS